MASKTRNGFIDSNARRRRSALVVKSDDNINKYNYKSIAGRNDPRNDAITELELIYDKLNKELLDSELLDRAERRDLPFSHQLIWNTDHNNNQINGHNDLNARQLVSTNNYNNNNGNYESFNKRRSMATIEALKALRNDHKCLDYDLRADQWMSRSRTPPYRRSAIPDIISDDFAFRKYNKSLSHSQLSSNPEITGFNSIKRINANKDYAMSYLMMTSYDDIYYNSEDNSIYTNDNDLKYLSKANIKVDDLTNRRLRQSVANAVPPPHPPFGIPNTIVSHSSPNDYVRAELDPKESNKVRFRYKSSVPHLIHDDMAFRSLRKESKSALTRTQSLTNNPNTSLPNISVAHRV